MIGPATGFPLGVGEARAELRQAWRERGLHRDISLPQAIAERIDQSAGRLVLQTERGRFEYTAQALHAGAMELAGALHRLGVESGDVVAVQLPNWPETMLVTLAVIYAGAAILPIVPIYGPKEVGFILRQSGAKVFVAPDLWGGVDYRENIRAAGPLPQLAHTVIIGDAPAGMLSWSQVEQLADPQFTLPAMDPEAVCVILYTSGTTSDPKGVLHTHQTIQAMLDHTRSPANQGQESSTLGSPSTGHIGQIIQLFVVVLQGGQVAGMDRWSPDIAAELVETYCATRMGGAPVFLYGLLAAAASSGRDVSSLREVRLGSTAIMPSDIERWEELGIVGYRSYGSTEHPFATGSWAEDTLALRAYTDGRPAPGTEIRIVDEKGNDLPLGSAGEVVLRGPQQFLGYLDPQLNADHYLPGGWFTTGDIGRLDADGALTITDRKKDIIIRGGENISAKDVEDTLARLPWIIECAAVAMPDPRLGEQVCAFAIVSDLEAATLEAIRAHFATSGMAKPKTPARLVLVPDFPRTATGKIKKFELREQLRREIDLGST